jgi:transposase
MTIVMGLDQHRAQITAEWIDTETGEIARARVAPAHREPVRRFAGRELEVALEATTGWRFVVEELRAVGAGVHLAEPAETSARRNKKRPKTDRADARHLGELLMLDKLPECWIPPDHLLDLRARVRLRHTLIDDRGEWQQRIRAVLYHHGVRHRRDLVLLTAEGHAWLQQAPLPEAAREQVTVALRMIDALDQQLPALDRYLRAYARRQAGCKALMGHFGIGELTSVAILAELGECRRFSSSRHAVRYVGMDAQRSLGGPCRLTRNHRGGGLEREELPGAKTLMGGFIRSHDTARLDRRRVLSVTAASSARVFLPGVSGTRRDTLPVGARWVASCRAFAT